jgi:Ca-activated chloride channel family protein
MAKWLVSFLVLAVGSSAAQTPPFRSRVDLVNLGVTVTDRRGEFLTDLRADDFVVLEDGKPQSISYFSTGSEEATAPEMHVGLLFDTSGSMVDEIPLARSAAIRFLNTLSDARDMTLVDFDTEVRVSRYGQADFPRMVERIRNRKPDGLTAMYDALGVYLDGASENEGRTILVLYTDGGDTRSAISFGDVMTLVRASDVTIYTVGLLGSSAASRVVAERSRLTQMATATGGQAFFPQTMTDVSVAYDQIVAQIRAQYNLGFISTNTAQDGTWRKIEIKLARPDLRGARTLSRKGYFAAYKP